MGRSPSRTFFAHLPQVLTLHRMARAYGKAPSDWLPPSFRHRFHFDQATWYAATCHATQQAEQQETMPSPELAEGVAEAYGPLAAVVGQSIPWLPPDDPEWEQEWP